MFPTSSTTICRAFVATICLFLITSTAHAFPTWIGVTGNVQRQTGGNPGTFTIMMNQYYSTLHASVGISVNGAGWKEYPMNYDGMSGKNSKWSHTPAAVFPGGATIKYYFRGWDDAGGSISDGTVATGYSFVSNAPAVIPVPGEVDVFGTMISMGSWLDDLNRSLFYLTTSDLGTTSLIRFGATRSTNDWIWERGSTTTGSAPVPMMKLDEHNRLTLYDPSTVGNSVIIIDPGGPEPGILVNGQRLLTTEFASGYLPLHPMQLTVGVNNSVGPDALAVGNSVQATGQNATALGSNTIATGENSIAVGDHTQAQGFSQFVTGTYNIPEDNSGDALFVIGNGVDEAHRANAMTVLRDGNVGIGASSPSARLDVNGNANIDGDLTVSGAISISPHGDLSMGEFTQGPTP